MVVGAGSNAEEAVFGVYSPKSAVFAYANPRNIVAHGFNFIAFFKVMFGGDEHCEVGFAASRGERRRNVFFGAVGERYAQNKHMLRHPAFVFAEVRSNSQRKALFTQQHVAAVSRVYRNNGIVLGEVHNISLVGVNVAFCVETFNKIAVFAKRVKANLSNSGHYVHIKNDVNRIGYFNADFRKRTAYYAHRVGDNVHRPAFHRTARNFVAKLVSLIGVHPIVYGTCVLAVFRAYESPVFNARNVVYLGAVKIAVGQKNFVKFNKFAAFYRFSFKRVNLFFASVNPYNFIGLTQLGAFLYEFKNFSVLSYSHK